MELHLENGSQKVVPPTSLALPNEMTDLRRSLDRLPEIVLFKDQPAFASHLACLGLEREIGTSNDELARFLFNAETGKVITLGSLFSERILHRGRMGLRIRSRETSRMEFRAKHIRHLLHPDFSFNSDGTVRELVLFPELIARIAELQGVDLVVVKRWALNSIFGGFDPKKDYYQTNFWELKNNDTLLFADLTRQRRIAFLGTHDLMAHIAGVNRCAFDILSPLADKVFRTLSNYFSQNLLPPIAAMILPYTIGVVLDDLAQPPSYNSASHHLVLDELLAALPFTQKFLNSKTVLTTFPKAFEKIILISRMALMEKDRTRVRSLVQEMIRQISEASTT